jgi:hypothetical protein
MFGLWAGQFERQRRLADLAWPEDGDGGKLVEQLVQVSREIVVDTSRNSFTRWKNCNVRDKAHYYCVIN